MFYKGFSNLALFHLLEWFPWAGRYPKLFHHKTNFMPGMLPIGLHIYSHTYVIVSYSTDLTAKKKKKKNMFFCWTFRICPILPHGLTGNAHLIINHCPFFISLWQIQGFTTKILTSGKRRGRNLGFLHGETGMNYCL